MKKQCVICKNMIKEKDNYYKVELYIKGKKKGTDYAHQVCWKNRNNMNSDLNQLVKGLKQTAIDNGLIKQEIII